MNEVLTKNKNKKNHSQHTHNFTAGERTHLGVEHDLRCSVPTGGYILCKETSVIMVRISHTSQTKITDLQKDE